jgi:hypothetical protein
MKFGLLVVVAIANTEPIFVNVFRAQESMPLAYVAWRAGTKYRVVVPVRQLGIDFWAP